MTLYIGLHIENSVALWNSREQYYVNITVVQDDERGIIRGP